jgi:uncharacterized LabA/DUF88 family protein
LFALVCEKVAMTDEPRLRKLAVLIDAENASPQIADGLFEEIAKIGEATIRRVYGDFSDNRLKNWSEASLAHAMVAQHTIASVSGKNTADIALVIDAMMLLYTDRCDGFCLVSSDSDFTGLATHIRERGMSVFGFGEEKTPESFRQACGRFIYTENLMALCALEAPAEKSIQAKRVIRPVAHAAGLISKAFEQLEKDSNEVTLSALGKRLNELKNDFDCRNYGKSKLSDLVREMNGFELRSVSGRLHVSMAADPVTGRKVPVKRKKAA